MAEYPVINFTAQTTAETRVLTYDITDLLAGGSATSASGSYAYQGGSASGSLATSVSGSTLSVVFGPPSAAGVYFIDARVVTSASAVRAVRWVVRVDW